MAGRRIAHYGTWKSPISGKILANRSSTSTELTVDGDVLYWLDLLPSEGGRYALYRQAGRGKVEEVLPAEFNVRTRVHEYGGGSYLAAGEKVYFSNFRDQLVYRAEKGGKPVPISKSGFRHADYINDEKRHRIIGVQEDHTAKGQLPVNSVAAVADDGSSSEVLVSGSDFYSSPRMDPSGKKLAWISWNFPNMPWDGTELWLGELGRDGPITKKRKIAGGKDESVLMPEWSPSGTLHFVSDRSGYWNIYRWSDGQTRSVTRLSADVGRPHWVFRISTYAFESEHRLVFTYAKNGTWWLARLDTVTGKVTPVKLPFTEINYVRATPGYVCFLAGSPKEPQSVVRVDLSDGKVAVVHAPHVVGVDQGYLSAPKHIRFTTTGGRKAYGFLYPPANRDYKGPRGEKPPLIVISHGGPTSQARTFLNSEIQAWTSRGFAVIDVNYGGSTGYGREYRRRLNGEWGVVDVDDCCNAALSLAKKGLVDRKRLIIRGGSAGGYTTLCALAFRDVFNAGASYFGVSDAEALAKDTHKFELRYSDILIAPYPQEKQLYRERSAINFPNRIKAPMIFFQGLEDVVVPPKQSETMVKSLRERGVPVAYIAFEGEQHGFRKAETIERAFNAELYFYSKVFGIKLPEHVDPVEIWNLKGLAS